MSDYTIIPKKELELLQWKKKERLSLDEFSEIIALNTVFEKYLRMRISKYKLALIEGVYRWREEIIYTKVEALDEIIKELAWWEQKLKEIRDEIAEKNIDGSNK